MLQTGEVAKRNAAFYLLGSFFAGFGGILAYGVSKMDGIAGREGWRWIFIIEGVITVAMGEKFSLFSCSKHANNHPP